MQYVYLHVMICLEVLLAPDFTDPFVSLQATTSVVQTEAHVAAQVDLLLTISEPCQPAC